MVRKNYFTFLTSPGLKPHHQMASVISRKLVGVGKSYLSAETQLAYCTASANWAQYFEFISIHYIHSVKKKWTYLWNNVLVYAYHAKAKMAALTCFKKSRSRILTRLTRCVQRSKPIKRQTAAVFETNTSVAVGERRYIQLIGRDNSGDISKLETFVLDDDM